VGLGKEKESPVRAKSILHLKRDKFFLPNRLADLTL
jgi:hypothetical protein